jgi:hypothetical protein
MNGHGCGDESRQERPIRPPRIAERLLVMFLSKEDRECVSGDLAEMYRTVISSKACSTKAKLWYWKQVITSIGFFLLRRLRAASSLGALPLWVFSVVAFAAAVALYFLVMPIPYFAVALTTGTKVSQVRIDGLLQWWAFLYEIAMSLFGMLAFCYSKNWMRFFWAYVIFFSSGSFASHPLRGAILAYYRPLSELGTMLLMCHLFLAVAFAIFVNRWLFRRLLRCISTELMARSRFFVLRFLMPSAILLVAVFLFKRTTDIYYVQMFGIRFLSIVLPGLLAVVIPSRSLDSAVAH